MSDITYVKELPPCDICKTQGHVKNAAYDAKIPGGPWANLCQLHFQTFNCSLGTGKGQRLKVRSQEPLSSIPFRQWMTKVDQVLYQKTICTSDGLPDQPYRSWHNEGVSPEEAAAMTLKRLSCE